MKILYSIQGTGNGHLARAESIVPHLKENFDVVEVMVSGFSSELRPSTFTVNYSRKGISFVFGKRGGINWWRTLFKNNLFQLFYDIISLPVNSYDLIISDFEPIAAWAGKMKKKKVVAMSHQSALIGVNVPQPIQKYFYAQFFIKWFAPFNERISFHFRQYDSNTLFPIIRDQIRLESTEVREHYVVYLPAYEDQYLIGILQKITKASWEIFSKFAQHSYVSDNCQVVPLDSKKFAERFSSSKGVVCGAGFETPAEAIFLGKKILVIPMAGQFEQDYNRAALNEMGIPSIDLLTMASTLSISEWVDSEWKIHKQYPDQRNEIVKRLKNYLLSAQTH